MLGPTVVAHERLYPVYQAMLVAEATESRAPTSHGLAATARRVALCRSVARKGGEPTLSGVVDQQIF